MNGFITTRHLFTHAHVIVANFGVMVYLRCIFRSVLSDKKVTFLDCIH